MSTFTIIKKKLEGFLRKYYTNELVKGALLFVGIGLLYFIITVFLEYFLWLGTTGRLILFWLFVGVETILFVKFIIVPILYLSQIRRGIDYKKASEIIGNHFPEVNDKLLNLLQLSENHQKSDLLLASIEQKSAKLTPIPFQTAINFRSNLRYAWYALIPISIILIVIFLGKVSLFTDSYKRVVDYKTAYEPPAPFQFFILNDSLTAVEGENFILKVNTAGELIPENAQINIDGNTFFLKQAKMGAFSYTFNQPKENVAFSLSANNVNSRPYNLRVIPTPSLISFKMKVTHPAYTGGESKILESTGNATVPEGSQIEWMLETKKTVSVALQLKDTSLQFEKNDSQFELAKRVYQNFDYSIATSNEFLKDYEKLGYSIAVVKDQYPEIKISERTDSTQLNRKLYLGQVSDDYAVKKVELVYFKQKSDSLQRLEITIKKGSFDEFGYAFPGDLNLEKGTSYEYYFEVTDNDAIHGGKSTKSSVFSYRKLTDSEVKELQLQQQQENIEDIQKSLNDANKSQKELQEITETNKQKSQLNFNDKKKIENYLERQQQQDEMMKRFHDELKENLEEFQKENKEESDFNELLQERLERQKKELEKNEKLMEELKEISDKINKEELANRLEQLAKQQKKDNRSLEQVLELTKRYYTSAKAEKVKQDLEELAKEQEELSKKEGDENNAEKQDSLNKKFKDIQKELDALEKQNKELQKPMELGTDPDLEKEVEQNQQEAKDKLEQKKQDQSTDQNKEDSSQKSEKEAKQKQRNAAQKMKEMGKKMGASMQAGGQEGMQEDMEMLRQILDNLLVFSFDQETVMERIQQYNSEISNLSVYLKKQNELRTLFEHIDDSLFALSLRQPKISEKINENITNVYYHIDKTLEQFAENELYQGVANQQYTLTAANELADFLSDALDNMQESMSSSGSSGGSSKDFQLPDIIQSQEQLNQQMQEGMKKGEKSKQNSEKGKNGEKNGENGVQKKDGQKDGETDNKSFGGEQMSEELFEIYKQQQQLRNALEEQLKNLNSPSQQQRAKSLAKQMEQIENDLLEKGFTNATEQKMIQLQHQLLKLENAAFEQGQKEERESNTNTKEYSNSSTNNLQEIQQYFNEVEILNRQALPLRQNYKQKVNAYFKEDD
ncbi:DUF4175 family protein [Galbibacter mesophilus]|uniref:DUF4175 family protein n=1 Tax=Galbibacter mesophilus TaxID=379069 RepID=UPI00191C9D9A|nr:DUF4175 family protein [Galbibacter mesophilus]MCM5662276.1 hypothetical protein [Galbibacter mesophilus]